MIVLATVQVALAQEPSAKENKKQTDAPAKKSGKAPFPDLVGALKKTPGCLGVETARTSSGKQVIFAWFENKQALMKWYFSDVHQEVMHTGFPDADLKKPLKDIPKDTGPILAIASITFAKESKFKATSLPISQIAIELYQPLPGGTYLGSRFAPDSVKVPNLRGYADAEKQQ